MKEEGKKSKCRVSEVEVEREGTNSSCPWRFSEKRGNGDETRDQFEVEEAKGKEMG